MGEYRSRIAVLAVAVLALLLVVNVVVQEEASTGQSSPTSDLSLVRTEAVREFARSLTDTAEALPTSNQIRTAATPASPASTPIGTSTPVCLGLRFVKDVTIPDNTEMTPAQVFTKTWQVANSGTCAWKPGFQVVLIGGVAMGGSPFRVAQTVGPGGSIQVSIKMAAPTSTKGIVQGTWKMTDENGEVFGDYLSVVIVVGGGTRTATATQITGTP